MIHNPEHRIAKMMREIRAFDRYASFCGPTSGIWHKTTRMYAIYAEHPEPPHASFLVVCHKPERCVRQALKQVRKIRGKR